jgi:hypothetical protein
MCCCYWCNNPIKKIDAKIFVGDLTMHYNCYTEYVTNSIYKLDIHPTHIVPLIDEEINNIQIEDDFLC